MNFKYVFGPVPSGRLGRSLGLDLLGNAICDFDCLYCEVGRTRIHTQERKPWVPAHAILQELEQWLQLDRPKPDFITLGGKGEPCLNSDMGAIIEGVHTLAPDIPVAVLTNATLLADPEVQKKLSAAQVVLPSMDTLVETEFIRLNKPCPGLTLAGISQGILDWASHFAGKIYLEILLVAGINDTEKNLEKLTTFCHKLQPNRIDVVTMTRPGADIAAHPVDHTTLALWQSALGAQHTLISASDLSKRGAPICIQPDQLEKAIINSITIRPQTPAQIAAAMGTRLVDVEKILSRLLKIGHIIRITQDNEWYYSLANQEKG